MLAGIWGSNKTLQKLQEALFFLDSENQTTACGEARLGSALRRCANPLVRVLISTCHWKQQRGNKLEEGLGVDESLP